MLCFGYKWLGAKRAKCISAWDFPSWDKDVNSDRDLAKAAYDIISQADILVTHNGARFDKKFIQTRLRFHKLPPLPPLVHIDTVQEAKKHLMVFNNRLNTLAKFLTDSEKLENGGWELWSRVMDREKKAMGLMRRYCQQDVQVLEKVFNELRPLIKLPNANMFIKETVCPNCGSLQLHKRGRAVKMNQVYQRLQCQDCGAWAQLHTKAGPR